MPDIRLVMRADDLGSFSGVTPSAIDAHRRGILRNASIMVGTPWFEDCVAPLTAVPSLCLGLHLTMCCEWQQRRWKPVLPAAQVPCLVDAEGFLLSDPLKIHQRGVDISQVLAECQAQLDRAHAHGLDITYADTHMGWEWIHPLPTGTRLQDLLLGWCQRNGIRWYRQTSIPALPPAVTTAHTLAGRLLAQIDSAPAGTYLVFTHPCWYGSMLEQETLGHAPGTIALERVDDWAMLSDPLFKAELARRGVTCLRYDEA
jgi:hypothetical protein